MNSKILGRWKLFKEVNGVASTMFETFSEKGKKYSQIFMVDSSGREDVVEIELKWEIINDTLKETITKIDKQTSKRFNLKKGKSLYYQILELDEEKLTLKPMVYQQYAGVTTYQRSLGPIN